MKNKVINGYMHVYMPKHPNSKNGYIQEHRLVVDNFIGRHLNKEEVVHHINFNKLDNRISNLMLFENCSKHMKFHTKLKQFGMTNTIRREIINRWNNVR